MLKKTFFGLLLTAILLAGMGGGCSYDNFAELYPDIACDTVSVSFANDIVPIMEGSCNSASIACHATGTPNPAILDNYDGVKAEADNGKLVSSVTWDGSTSTMPSGSSSKIDDCSIRKIELWVAAGAPDN